MGQIKEHETVIAGVRYRTKTHTAVEGLRLMPRLMSILSPGVFQIVFGATDEARQLITDDKERSLPIIAAIARAAHELPDGLQVVWDLLSRTEFELAPDESTPVWQPLTSHASSHFAGDYYRLFAVAWWVAVVSFGDP